ncbi:MAG: DedA family protein [Candidatus Paceibacterota bacterium]
MLKAMDFYNAFIFWLEHHESFGYLAVFLISAAESMAFVGLLIPGGNLAIGMGVLTSYGFFGFWRMILLSTIGAIVGDVISFYLGKWVKRFFKKGSKILKLNYLEIGEKFFIRHGGKSVFIGRFVGPMRPVIPFVAGMFSMRFWKFMFYNATSAFLWSLLFLTSGFLGGEWWKKLESLTMKMLLFVLPTVFILIAMWLARERKQKKETK